MSSSPHLNIMIAAFPSTGVHVENSHHAGGYVPGDSHRPGRVQGQQPSAYEGTAASGYVSKEGQEERQCNLEEIRQE